MKKPRYLFNLADKKYHLTQKVICDIGCGYGENLPHCLKGSYGIEIDSEKTQNSWGVAIFNRDIIKDNLAGLPRVDAIWCCAVIEHLESPHILLRKAWTLLKPSGLLALYAPTIPPIRAFKHTPYFGKYFIGHTHSDHINAFTPRTLKFTMERAGFRVIKTHNFPFLDGCLCVAERINNWQYPKKSRRKT